MSFNIRKYRDEDLDSVMASWESASSLAHPFLSDEFVATERRDIPIKYLPMAETWVIEDRETVMGFIALIGNEVGAIFVKPQFHGVGAGKALMDMARDLHGDLEVEVFKENSIGRAFYDRYGFQPMHEHMHEPSGHVLIRMQYKHKR